jgi:hypothetical protein
MKGGFKMKFNFRKIASVLASAVMIGSTLGIAAAANYPAPFTTGDVAIVYGSNANIVDAVQAGLIQTDLQARLGTKTSGTSATSSGGDSVNIGTSARKIYYADTVSSARTALSSTDMPSVLADGKVSDLAGIQYGYTQIIKPGSAPVTFGTSGGDIADPILYIDAGNSGALTAGYLYNYTLTLSKNLNVSDATNVQGQKITILGIDYVIGTSSTNTSLYLYGSGESITVNGGESKTVSVGGKEHTVELVTTTSSTTAKLVVDGISKTVTKGSNYAYAGDLNVYVKDVVTATIAGDVRSVDLIIGANTLYLNNGQTVKKGADLTSVQGTLATVSGANGGLISGFTVAIAPSKTSADDIQSGKSFTDPVFGGLKLQFAGVVPSLDDTTRAKVMVSTDNTQSAYVTFTSALAGTAGEQKLQYAYDNDTTSTGTAPLLAHKTIASNSKGLIHVLEGEAAREGDWIVINAGDNGGILNVDSISVDTGTTAKVTFSDAITGVTLSPITLTLASGQLTNANVNLLGGTGYTVTMPSTNTTVNVSWNAAGNLALFPRIKLASGGWMAMLAETNITAFNATTKLIMPDGLTTLGTTGTNITVNSSNNAVANVNANGINWGVRGSDTSAAFVHNITVASGAACNFNATYGPTILVIEPKKWNDASYGDFICIPMTTAGSKEIAIARAVPNGTNSGFTSYTSDVYKAQAIDQFGTLVTDEQRTNENGVATLSIPASQMYLDVLFTAPSTTVTPGTSGSGGSSLGNVLVTDAEVAAGTSNGVNLLVVGGSCINTVAAKILGSDIAVCGADFTTKTGVGAGQYLIQSVKSPYNDAKVAVLVAGYDKEDTVNAAKYLTTVATDIAVGKKYKGTTATTAEPVTTTA